MKLFRKFLLLTTIVTAVILLSSCSETAENEHLPEYCQTYSGFMSIASKDLYDLLGDINRYNYLTAISKIELEFEVDDPNIEIDLNGIQCFQNLTSLTLIGQSFKDISEISALKNIQKISLINTSVVSIDSFKNLSKVNDLTISNTKTLQSVDGIEEMTKLINLDLSDNGIVNIDGLNNLVNLEVLNLSNNEIVSFPSINQLDKLEYLTLSNNNISELGEDLSGLRNLISFVAKNNNIIDIAALDDLTSLEILDLSFNNLGAIGEGVSPDFTSLSNSPYLSEIYLNDNDLSSIEGLRGKDLPLEVLALENNRISDITPISDYTGLTDLSLYNNEIVNIDNLSGMINLVDIDLRNNLIVDFTDLLTIPNVELVNLSGNQITFIPDITSWSSIVSLNLDSNLLTDTSGVNGSLSLEELIITNNGLETLSGISNMPNLENLAIDYEVPMDELDPDYNPNLIRVIEDSFNNLHRLDLTEEGVLVLGFELGSNVEIYGSFNDLINIVTIDFTDMDINIIDEFSINLINLHVLNVSNNNIQDLSFILGNVNLEELDISNNNFTNLEIISGVTTDDLSNLQNVLASDIVVGNDLVNAFNELDDLNFIDLSGTNIITINNSFNKLPQLSSLLIDSFGLESIEDSFNYIYASYSQENVIIFNSGNIGLISNSFNGGVYDTIETGFYEQIIISNQSPLIIETLIVDSFNNITVAFQDSLTITLSNFKTIDNSFNYSEYERLFLSSNDIEVITNSFIDTVVNDMLYLSYNKIQDISTISYITSVNSLKLGNNLLTSISSIDNIALLTSVDISSQYNEDTLTYTLTVLDGLNNLPLLTNAIMHQNQFDSITGLQNIPIEDITYQYFDNNNTTFSIGPNAFSGTNLKSLNLDGSLLTDITFLDNLPLLTSLTIDIDINTFEFNNHPLASSLTYLDIYTEQSIDDFSIFATYDLLETFNIETNALTSITNLDNMDRLTIFALANKGDIIEINNSFNNLSNFNIPSNYFTNYVNLNTVTNSFDGYTNSDAFTISDSIGITNSLNNAVQILVINDASLSPSFDTLSFDNLITIEFENPNYTSYAFLNNYPSLTTVRFYILNHNITDISNSNIEAIDIVTLGSSVDTLELVTSETGYIMFNSTSTGLLSLTSNANNYLVEANNLDVTFNNEIIDLTIYGNLDSVVINSPIIETLSLANFSATSLTIASAGLVEVITVDGPNYIAAATITTDASNIKVEINSDTINLYALNSTQVDLLTPGGTTTLFTNEANITGDIDGNNIIINNSNLVSLVLSSPAIGTLTIDAAVFNNLNMTSSNIDTLDLTTNVASLVIVGDIRTGNISDSSLNDLDVLANTADNVFNISTSNNEAFTLNISAFEVNFNAVNLPSITVSNTTAINNSLQLNTMSNLATLSLGSAYIYQLDLTSDVATFDIAGTNLGNAALTLQNATQLNIAAADTDMIIDSSVNSVTFDASLDTLSYNNLNATNITFSNTSSANIISTNNSSVTNFALGTASIAQMLIDSVVSSFTLVGTNVDDLQLTANSVNSVNVDIADGDLFLSSTNVGVFNTNVKAKNYFNFVQYSELIVDNASVITRLSFGGSPNLDTISTGTADIAEIDMIETATSLNVSGTNINELSISSSTLNDLVTTVNAATVLVVGTATTANLAVDTSTSYIRINATDSPTVTVDSTTLETAEFIGNNLIMNIPNIGTDFTLDATATNVILDSNSLVNLSFVNGSTINDLTISNNLITTLDLTNANVSNFNMNETQATLNLTASAVDFVTINTLLLNDFTFTGHDDITLDVVYPLGTGVTALSFTGTSGNTSFTNPDLLTFNMLNGNLAGDLLLDTDSLTTYLDFASSLGNLTIESSAVSIEVATDSDSIAITGPQTLGITAVPGTMTVITGAVTLNLDGATTSFVIDASAANAVNGVANNVLLTSNSVGFTTVDLVATQLSVNNAQSASITLSAATTLQSIILDMDSLSDYTESSSSVDTVQISTLVSSLDITSNASDYNVTGTDTLSLITTITEEFGLFSDANQIIVDGTTGVLNIPVSLATSIITTDIGTVSLSTAINPLTFNYIGATDLALNLITMSDVMMNSASSTNNVITGNVDNLTIGEMSSSLINFSGVNVNTKLTMNNLGYTDLSIITANLIANTDTIEVNSLSNVNIEQIINKLSGSNIKLISPIIDDDVYNYYYDIKYNDLTAQEAIDTVRYDALRADEVVDILAIFRTNSYFIYTLDVELNEDIDTQGYEAMQYYYDAYLVGEGTTEAQLILDNDEQFVQDIKDSIQATLNNPDLTINSGEIDNAVILEIEVDADTAALADVLVVGFTNG